MITLYKSGGWLVNGNTWVEDDARAKEKQATAFPQGVPDREESRRGTMAHRILAAHNAGDEEKLKITFDALTSHDITYVGIVQTARASGLERFPMPYVLTCCHNSLCAVGGTINEDDHLFGLSAAKKYGGVFVPPHQAVIHQYMREMMSGCGKMILGSDSHTRYGALGTMAVGEGGPELVKQLLGRTWDLDRPEVVAIQLTGKPQPGVGPQDVALAIIGAVFPNGMVKNKVMEFVGDGIAGLSADYRIGIDVMTTETTCLSSIWQTDDVIRKYYTVHGRPQDYSEIKPADIAWYDGMVSVDLSKIKPMIAMPFHPSNVYAIDELLENLDDILRETEVEGQKQLGDAVTFTLRDKIRGKDLLVQQGVIAGCAGGTYENLCDAADIIRGYSIGSDVFSMSVYPASQPVNLALTDNGVMSDYLKAGVVVRTAFCGPCFGAGDVPANNALSIRHSTRNFPNREGSKPGDGQIASVALMDARSIAATARNGGKLTPATALDVQYKGPKFVFDKSVYTSRCYDGTGKPDASAELQFGPNIADWPDMQPLGENILLQVASVITDPVTTTDELIPSGETSSYRSNPLRLAEFTLSRKDPGYVGRAKAVKAVDDARRGGADVFSDDLPAHVRQALQALPQAKGVVVDNTQIGSVVCSIKPGDGSAREQAASCQKVLGTFANIAHEYATKRYRSNLINWGMLPFVLEDASVAFEVDDIIFVPGIRDAVQSGAKQIPAWLVRKGSDTMPFGLTLDELTDDEKDIILSGCLINYYAGK